MFDFAGKAGLKEIEIVSPQPASRTLISAAKLIEEGRIPEM